jgi:hypothetical protein
VELHDCNGSKHDQLQINCLRTLNSALAVDLELGVCSNGKPLDPVTTMLCPVSVNAFAIGSERPLCADNLLFCRPAQSYCSCN